MYRSVDGLKLFIELKLLIILTLTAVGADESVTRVPAAS